MADNASFGSRVLRQCDSIASARGTRACAGANPGLGPILLTLSGLTGCMDWLAKNFGAGLQVNKKQTVAD